MMAQKVVWAILCFSLCCWLTYMLAINLVHGSLKHWKRLRHCSWKVVLECMAMLFGILVIAAILVLFLPWMRWSWVTLIMPRSEGSIGGTNLLFLPIRVKWFGEFFLILLFMNIPMIAYMEEYIFRSGTEDWTDGWIRSILFGLVHCIAGTPVCAAFLLPFVGLWLTHHYFRGGTKRSTLYHTVYNMVAIGFATVLLVIIRFGHG